MLVNTLDSALSRCFHACMNTRTTVKPSLRQWRKKRGVTLEEISDLTGYSISMLSRVERGQRRLSALDRVHLARLLDARVRDLFPPPRRG